MFGFGGGSDGELAVLNASGAPAQISMPGAMKKIAECDELLVKQRVAKLEQLCSCWESRNKYDIYSGRSRIFFAEEKTGCCCRQVQTTLPDCAPFEVDIDFLGMTSYTTENTALKMKKDCGCTCCCINRPEVEMFDNKGFKIGSIKDPCPLCPGNMNFDVRDHEGNVLLYAESGMCQWGLCCPCPCGPCKTVEFPVKDPDGNQVGMMTKHMKGFLKMMCCSSCFEDVENYKIYSKNIKDPRAKTLLMGLAIFTYFRYFSNTGDDDAGASE